jgi:hypothetical protein
MAAGKGSATVMGEAEIVPGDKSGGATTSHTIVVPALTHLLAAVDPRGEAAAYEHAVLEDNVLGKETSGARHRTLRYLRELYLLRSDSVLFRSLRDLWPDDPDGQPLLAGLCALARDPVFRSTSSAVLAAEPGDELLSADLAEAAGTVFPSAYSAATLAKIGRNTLASWQQVGHLEVAAARTGKVRRRPTCTPATTAYALLLGQLQGVRGAALFDTLWARVLDRPREHLVDLAIVASQRSLIEFRHSGGVTEVRFAELLRPMEGQLL